MTQELFFELKSYISPCCCWQPKNVRCSRSCDLPIHIRGLSETTNTQKHLLLVQGPIRIQVTENKTEKSNCAKQEQPLYDCCRSFCYFIIFRVIHCVLPLSFVTAGGGLTFSFSCSVKYICMPIYSGKTNKWKPEGLSILSRLWQFEAFPLLVLSAFFFFTVHMMYWHSHAPRVTPAVQNTKNIATKKYYFKPHISLFNALNC